MMGWQNIGTVCHRLVCGTLKDFCLLVNTKNLIFVFVWHTKRSGAEEDAPENWEVEELDVDAMDGFTRVPRSYSIHTVTCRMLLQFWVL